MNWSLIRQNIASAVKTLKNQLIVMHLALQDPRTPWTARVLIVLVLAYALSPIDLIPDFIPVLGYLDDIIIVPLGIYFALKFIPEHVYVDCRQQAADYVWHKQKNWIAGSIIILVWLIVIYFIVTSIIDHQTQPQP